MVVVVQLRRPEGQGLLAPEPVQPFVQGGHLGECFLGLGDFRPDAPVAIAVGGFGVADCQHGRGLFRSEHVEFLTDDFSARLHYIAAAVPGKQVVEVRVGQDSVHEPVTVKLAVRIHSVDQRLAVVADFNASILGIDVGLHGGVHMEVALLEDSRLQAPDHWLDDVAARAFVAALVRVQLEFDVVDNVLACRVGSYLVLDNEHSDDSCGDAIPFSWGQPASPEPELGHEFDGLLEVAGHSVPVDYRSLYAATELFEFVHRYTPSVLYSCRRLDNLPEPGQPAGGATTAVCVGSCSVFKVQVGDWVVACVWADARWGGWLGCRPATWAVAFLFPLERLYYTTRRSF